MKKKSVSNIKIRAKYIRFSEEVNALDYLTKACYFIETVETNPTNWKWVIICLFGSLYGFAICAVQGTNSETVKYVDRQGNKTLISFRQALEWCQDKNKMKWTVMSKELVLTKEQDNSINKLLKQFRDNFEHYQPSSWSIEIHGFPEMAIDVLDVIKFLALDTGNYIHLNNSQRDKIRSLVFQSRKVIKNSKLYRESVIANKQYSEKQERLLKISELSKQKKSVDL